MTSPSRHVLRWLVATTLTLTLSSCSRESIKTPLSGLALKMNEAPVYTLSPDWIFGATDSGSVSLGMVSSASLGADGSVYVADRTNSTIVVLDGGGRVVRAFGRPGNGPGELSHLRAVAVANDTVFAMSDRLVLFKTDGTFLGASPPGSALFAYSEDLHYDRARGLVIRKPTHASMQRTTREELLQLIPYDVKAIRSRPSLLNLKQTYYRYGKVLDSPRSLDAVPDATIGNDGRIYYVGADSFHIEVLDPRGGGETTIVASVPKVPTSKSDFADFMKTWKQILGFVAAKDSGQFSSWLSSVRGGSGANTARQFMG